MPPVEPISISSGNVKLGARDVRSFVGQELEDCDGDFGGAPIRAIGTCAKSPSMRSAL